MYETLSILSSKSSFLSNTLKLLVTLYNKVDYGWKLFFCMTTNLITPEEVAARPSLLLVSGSGFDSNQSLIQF